MRWHPSLNGIIAVLLAVMAVLDFSVGRWVVALCCLFFAVLNGLVSLALFAQRRAHELY